MRIAVCGTANTGKSTFISDFIKTFPTYKQNSKTYRTNLMQTNLPHSKNTNQKTQLFILKHMVDTIKKYKTDDNIIFDRCPIDNLVYSIWAEKNSTSDIDNVFIKNCLPLIEESMNYLDIIIILPLSKLHNINIINNGIRETDENYIQKIDYLFNFVKTEYSYLFKDTEIIDLFGNREERLNQFKNITHS